MISYTSGTIPHMVDSGLLPSYPATLSISHVIMTYLLTAPTVLRLNNKQLNTSFSPPHAHLFLIRRFFRFVLPVIFINTTGQVCFTTGRVGYMLNNHRGRVGHTYHSPMNYFVSHSICHFQTDCCNRCTR